MSVEVDKAWGDAPAKQPGVVRMLERFLDLSAEFHDSILVVATSHPSGDNNTSQRAVLGSGNAYARDGLVSAYLEGVVPDGAWYVGPCGLLSDADGSPQEWDDAVSTALWDKCVALEYALRPHASGLLVLATCGGGPVGTTKVLARATGNSLSVAAALSEWFDGLNKE